MVSQTQRASDKNVSNWFLRVQTAKQQASYSLAAWPPLALSAH
jgi:hypothetical protein